MINISRVWCGLRSDSDRLRYGHGHGGRASERKPVVVWNMTRSCNLRCIHCYTDSEPRWYSGELSRPEISAFLRDLAGFEVPALLLSGGEPLMHHDFWDVAEEASKLGLRLTLSTNGNLITSKEARKLKQTGFTYVGISLDGIGEINDKFRGKQGAYERAVEAFRQCMAAGQRTGLRMTLTRHNIEALDEIFDFIEAMRIPRACFYHLAYSGRGSAGDDVTPAMTRQAIDKICDRATQFARKRLATEILTVGSAVDGPYLILKATREKHPKLNEIRELLEWNRGNHFSSGTGIANVDFLGDVHPDQFWQTMQLGNIREKPFSRIWTGVDGLLPTLRRREQTNFSGRCGSCRWFGICGGGLRARAHRVTGSLWSDDPACYLDDSEICAEPACAELQSSG